MDKDVEVYIKYESEIFLLDKVSDYKSLCEQIEDILKGVKAQDLKITYQIPSGMVVTVKNDPTLNAAKKKMKPELKLTCVVTRIIATEK